MHRIGRIRLLEVVISYLLIAGFAQTTQAKSVYAIIDHVNNMLGAYGIQGNQIEYETQHQIPEHGSRSIDLAIDSENAYIFVTYEQSNIIEIVNAKSMTNEGSVTAPGASDLAGMVFDQTKRKLYAVDRETYNLFVYLWDARPKRLTPNGVNPKILSQLGGLGAYGAALDTANNHLYVTNSTSTVHYYDTSDWTHVGSVDVGETAIDVDIYADGGYLYVGGYRAHDYLVKVDLSTGIPQSYDVGAGVIGLAVDPDSSYIYTTTYHNQLRVYDASSYPFTLTDYENISGGAGVCVPLGDVSYNPDVFMLSKADNVVTCASPPDQFTYTISYNANGYADTGVVIVDYLPLEVDYLSCTGGGSYDAPTHTVTWTLGDISGSASGTLEISVQVNNFARPARPILIRLEKISEKIACPLDIATGGGDIIEGERFRRRTDRNGML